MKNIFEISRKNYTHGGMKKVTLKFLWRIKMNNEYGFNMSKEDAENVLKYLQSKLQKATTYFDKYYLNLRIKDYKNYIKSL